MGQYLGQKSGNPPLIFLDNLLYLMSLMNGVSGVFVSLWMFINGQIFLRLLTKQVQPQISSCLLVGFIMNFGSQLL